jgi:hypothetical protein
MVVKRLGKVSYCGSAPVVVVVVVVNDGAKVCPFRFVEFDRGGSN